MKTMKKVFSLTVIVLAFLAFTSMDKSNAQTTYNVQSKAPYISASLKPIIAKYRNENYVGAMLDLEALLKKEKKNTAAKYYLALCYTKLGYRAEAENIYNEIVRLNDNITLVHYSQRALNCIGNPDGEGCSAKPKEITPLEEPDDMTKFIQSGQRIHPSALDQITRERMERKIQEDAAKKQDLNLQSQAPTNEEIMAAINTLAKVGINPLQNQFASLNMMNNQYPYLNPAFLYSNAQGNSNADISKMMLYSQLNNQFSGQFGTQGYFGL